jgi:inhibitor of cysteine peptidase
MSVLKRVCVLLVLLLNFPVFAAKTEPGIYTEDKLAVMVTKEQPQFIIRLKANPTTGYNWFLRDYDTAFITPLKHKYEAPNTKLMGAPGYDVWTFRVKPAGFVVPQMTQIHFAYARPWEVQGQGKQLVFRVATQ